MPEAPEVEALTRYLRRRLVGRNVTTINIYATRLARGLDISAFEELVSESRVDIVERVGKYITIQDTRRADCHWFLHLGMTGRLYIDEVPINPKHEAARISFEQGAPLRFHDPRKFGAIGLVQEVMPRLGPDALSPEWTCERFEKVVHASARPIKSLLLEQSRISGIGNIYANETLAEARIHPGRASHSLTREECARLLDAIRSTLRRAIRFGASIDLDWKGTTSADRLFYFGSTGAQPNVEPERFLVYDRANRECARCQTRIERTVSGGRSNFFCPRCQRAPD